MVLAGIRVHIFATMAVHINQENKRRLMLSIMKHKLQVELNIEVVGDSSKFEVRWHFAPGQKYSSRVIKVKA